MDTKDQDQDHQKSTTPQPSTQPSQSSQSTNIHSHHQSHLNNNHNLNHNHYTHFPQNYHHLQQYDQSNSSQDCMELSRTVSPISISVPSLCRHNSSSSSSNLKKSSSSIQLNDKVDQDSDSILPEINMPKTPPPIEHSESRNHQNQGTFSNFQLPNDILKNLTPIIKSPPKDRSKNEILRKNHLKDIQLKLNNQNQKINKTIKNLKIENNKKLQFQTFKLNENLKFAKYRRENYLNLVRARAGRFLESGSNENNLKQKSKSLNDYKYTKSQNHQVSQEQSYHVKFNHLSQSTLNNISNFQRRSQQYLFKNAITFLKNSNFLHKFDKMSFNQVLTCLNTESTIKKSICHILRYLHITKDLFEIKIFLYCFIMISDFNDCMINGPQQPGFNSNLNKRDKNGNDELNFFNNFIWVLLYKYSSFLIHEFTQLIDNATNANTLQVSSKFSRYWEDYKFIFKIFKWNHYINIKKILFSSISIVDQQLIILDNHNVNNSFGSYDNYDNEIIEQKGKLEMELKLLNKYDLKNLQIFNSSDNVKNFNSILSQKINVLFANYQNQNSLNGVATTREFIQNKPSLICFKNWKFHIPDFVPIDKWRSYWRSHYFKKFCNSINNAGELNYQKKSYPSKLKSGYLGEINNYYFNNELNKSEDTAGSNFNYFELIDSIIDINSISLKEIYGILFDYYIHFSSGKNYKNFNGSIDEEFENVGLRGTYYDYGSSSSSTTTTNHDFEYLNKIKLLFMHYDQLNKFQHILNFKNLLPNEEIEFDLIVQLKYEILIQYLKNCRFNNNNENGNDDEFTNFKRFENLKIILNSTNFQNLKFSIYTFNPQLLFPKFYKIYLRGRYDLPILCNNENETSLNGILQSSFKNNLSDILCGKEDDYIFNVFKFFNTIFIDQISNINFLNHENDEDEIISNFKDNFVKYNQNLIKLIDLNCFGIMYQTYFQINSNISQSYIFKLHKLYNEYEIDENECDLNSLVSSSSIGKQEYINFFNYYKYNNDKISKLLLLKWSNQMKEKINSFSQHEQFQFKSFNSTEFQFKLQFQFFTKEIIELSTEIFKFNKFLYNIYRPIFNWIGEDLNILI
ncbi:uncharacterized protein KGF55_003125 [Candida pseudojiufengensis]|uniref:uncharacterized protein n=1 Tax=Candida pseudojiufengensis TaxID=497109 RepID=UPI0022255F3D|nr:uncharacterized protein KGF55_003125 [Candida pseudojiufengensis]KAI5963333.1 hypothetical protein KGF55_003125 [Candida pseudojiufengensis]